MSIIVYKRKFPINRTSQALFIQREDTNEKEVYIRFFLFLPQYKAGGVYLVGQVSRRL